MNPTPTTDTQRLRELLAAATPGPWETEHTPGGVFRNILHLFDKPDERGFIGEHVVIQGMLEPDDADLIAALRNEAPALLDEIEGLRIDRRNLIEEMERRDVVQEDRIRELLSERDSLRRENEELKAKLR